MLEDFSGDVMFLSYVHGTLTCCFRHFFKLPNKFLLAARTCLRRLYLILTLHIR